MPLMITTTIILNSTTRCLPPTIINLLSQVRSTTSLPRWSTTRNFTGSVSINSKTSAAATATTLVLFFCSSLIGVSSLSFFTSSSSSSTSFASSPFGLRLLSSSSTKKPSSLLSLASTLSETLTATNISNCQGKDNEESDKKLDIAIAITNVTDQPPPPFNDSILSYDHYNGVTIHLDKYHNHHHHNSNGVLKAAEAVENFARKLKDSLRSWKLEGKKGVWVHAGTETSMYLDVCIQNGFQFHKILPTTTTTVGNDNDDNNNNAASNNLLVLSQWLPNSKNKLPLGPTHQVGVGCVVFNPQELSQMLVVKEKSGPAASYDLWKMPTGLVDPNEYVHDGARRELYEETSLNATLQSIISIRQAHRGGGATSDMFFVCSMELDDIEDDNCNSNNNNNKQQKKVQQWKACEEEISDIQWMSVEDYCTQNRWGNSPLYEELNDRILKESKNKQRRQQLQIDEILQKNNTYNDDDTIGTNSGNYNTNIRVSSIIEHHQLELGFGRTDGKTEALFVPKTTIMTAPVASTTDSFLSSTNRNNDDFNSSRL